jgi:chemotaxis methyl-accepting protein methylase
MSLDALADVQPEKTMLRVYDAAQKGATAFFRNRPLLATIDELLREKPGHEPLRILFHASSIGAEVYSFVIHSMISGLAIERDLQVFATDLNPNFLNFAREGATRDRYSSS